MLQTRTVQKKLIPVAKCMKSEIDRRFSKCLDPYAIDCNPTYMMALLLNPCEATLLNSEQIKCASQELKRCMEVRVPIPAYSASEAEVSEVASEPSHHSSPKSPDGADVVPQPLSQLPDHPPSSSSSTDNQPPPPKKSNRQFIDKILQKNIAEIKKKEKRPDSPIDVQIQRYIRKITCTSPPSDVDPLQYWIERYKRNESALAAVALDILTAPASSAPAERVFSIAGEITAGKRNRLEKNQLEREVLLRRNMHYVPTNIC